MIACSYLSLATAAITHNLVRPVLTTEPVLFIREGRHLLLSNKNESFVANSTALSQERNRTNEREEESVETEGGGLIYLITGPNNSGQMSAIASESSTAD